MKKSSFTEWMKEASSPSPPREDGRGRDALPDDGNGSNSDLWERVYQPFVATMQEWIDLNA